MPDTVIRATKLGRDFKTVTAFDGLLEPTPASAGTG